MENLTNYDELDENGLDELEELDYDEDVDELEYDEQDY